MHRSFGIKKRTPKRKQDNDDEPPEFIQNMFKLPINMDKQKNHIYFYSMVDQETCLELNRKINDLNKIDLSNKIGLIYEYHTSYTLTSYIKKYNNNYNFEKYLFIILFILYCSLSFVLSYYLIFELIFRFFFTQKKNFYF